MVELADAGPAQHRSRAESTCTAGGKMTGGMEAMRKATSWLARARPTGSAVHSVRERMLVDNMHVGCKMACNTIIRGAQSRERSHRVSPDELHL